VDRLRLVVLETVASSPFASMEGMPMPIVAGPARLGHDVPYVEWAPVWSYDAIRQMKVDDAGPTWLVDAANVSRGLASSCPLG
jgi:hypothetical protein